MITDSFDKTGEGIVTPEPFFGKRKDICKLAIATFSAKIYQAVLKRYKNTKVGTIDFTNPDTAIHLLEIDGNNIAFYCSQIGATLAGTNIIEVNWQTGAENFIFFGSSGSLDSKVTAGKYVIPTAAYRDEGMSYHYAEPADYIEIKNSSWLESFFKNEGLPYVTGKVWTTDAVYRETKSLVQKRTSEGCVAVDMELSGVQAVCDFYGFNLYEFLETGDTLDTEDYSTEGLNNANHSLDKFFIALKIAEALKYGAKS